LVDVIVTERHGFRIPIDRLVKATVCYRTGALRGSVTAKWNQSFPFQVPNASESKLEFELTELDKSQSLDRTSVPIAEGDNWPQLPEDIEMLTRISIHEGLPSRASDGNFLASSTLSFGRAIDKQELKAPDECRENFLFTGSETQRKSTNKQNKRQRKGIRGIGDFKSLTYIKRKVPQ
jgi:hypothetical protein